MYTAINSETPTHLDHFCRLPNLPKLDTAMVIRQQADQHGLLMDGRSNDPVARCSLWWHQTPAYPGHQLGFIGHFAALNAEAGSQMLQLACDQLAQRGCTLAVGPIDGNTWQPYRYVVETGCEPPFFLEPEHPADWPDHFTENGFTPFAHYFSALNVDLTGQHPHLAEIEARVAANGIRLRTLDLARFEAELRKIYPLILDSFDQNFLYTPLSQPAFLAQYQPLQAYLQPELVLIAEYDQSPVGFVFAMPDLCQAQRDQTIDTVVIKTVAVHPDWAGVGLGTLLVEQCQAQAHKHGFKRAIHSLMHETNISRKISAHYGEPIRRYALFARPLSGEPA